MYSSSFIISIELKLVLLKFVEMVAQDKDQVVFPMKDYKFKLKHVPSFMHRLS